MSLSTEYRGYTISYAENMDTWGCYECGVTAPTLSKAKEKIDALHLKLRKESAVSCYEYQVDSKKGTIKLIDSKIIDFLKECISTSWSSNKRTHDGYEVAVMAQRQGSEKASRRTAKLRTLIADTPEALEAVNQANEIGQRLAVPVREFDDAVAAIPRVQFADISKLVEASGHKFTEE